MRHKQGVLTTDLAATVTKLVLARNRLGLT